MKPIFQKLTAPPEEGFAFKNLRSSGFDCPWHMHPEYELILVLQSNGYRVVGDNIAPLSPGDLVFVGPGLPHIWQNEPAEAPVHALLIQFGERFLCDGLLRLPELDGIRRLFKRAARGLHVTGATRDAVAARILGIAELGGLERIIQVLRILERLAISAECQPLASAAFALELQPYDQERMNRVFQFVNAGLNHVLRLAEVARVAGLSEGAFSRFFHVHTGKSFPEFLNELRIGRACRLLIEADESITQICYECGFTNLSNFNRQFLRLKGQTPTAFRNRVRRNFAHGTDATD